jgi:hypothetical protein
MLCKIWGFHGGDYEECRLLGYKNPFLTSQETHYVSATELSRFMLSKIWGFHDGILLWGQLCINLYLSVKSHEDCCNRAGDIAHTMTDGAKRDIHIGFLGRIGLARCGDGGGGSIRFVAGSSPRGWSGVGLHAFNTPGTMAIVFTTEHSPDTKQRYVNTRLTQGLLKFESLTNEGVG